MPITSSAKKALRQSTKRRKQNLDRKKSLRAEINSLKKLIVAGKMTEAKEAMAKVYKAADKMAKVNFIKKGKASRIKSRLSKRLNAAENKAK